MAKHQTEYFLAMVVAANRSLYLMGKRQSKQVILIEKLTLLVTLSGINFAPEEIG